MADSPAKLRASEVLNWDYLVQIGQKPQGRTTSLAMAITGFAYDFTSTTDEDIRDQMLKDFLQNATNGQSRETAEEIVKTLASQLQSDRNALRKFAKEGGVRLSHDWWLARRDPTFSNP